MAIEEDYQALLSDLVKKQMVMLGPNVALATARKVSGLSVADDGVVTALSEDPQVILSAVAKQYMVLSGAIAQMTLESIIAKYPGVRL